LSDETNIPEANSEAPASAAPSETAPQKPSAPPAPAAGGLPGLGAKPAGGLPGLGAKPAGGLPGLGGKPAGGLPGLGAKPAGGLPGVGAPGGLGGAAPPFMQQQQPQGPSPEQISRDPFGADTLPSARPSYVPDGRFSFAAAHDDTPLTTAEQTHKNRRMLFLAAGAIALAAVVVGYMMGIAISGRNELNKAIRDALIVQYEMKQLATLFDEVQGVVSTAINDAQNRKFNEKHLEFLAEKVQGNPFKASLFTERNYKTFDPLALQMMVNLFQKWGEMSNLIDEHRRASMNDEDALKTSGDEFIKLMNTNYGVIFKRNAQAGDALEAELVILGAANGNKIQVQADTGSVGDSRIIWNPQGEDSKLSKEPEEYVVIMGQMSKATLLKNVTQSHWEKYVKRLTAMAEVLKTMREDQDNLHSKLNLIVSQEPVHILVDINTEKEFEEYKAKASKAAASESDE
jgi:hypothetical protein